MSEEKRKSLLPPYRVLDLTNEKGFLCGKILGDLGADVIKIEPPGGDAARNIGPFFGQSEESLLWLAYNNNKRGITLNIESKDGREIFKRLAERADIIAESFPPGYMDSLGIGYSILSQMNEGIIMASISPFGSEGPYRDYKGSDLTIEAMGGFVFITGEPERPPVRISVDQVYPNAGAQAAMGIMIALYYRSLTGEGQHIDVSMQECAVSMMATMHQFWTLTGSMYRRLGARRFRFGLCIREVWPCKDGYIAMRIVGGEFGRGIGALVEWMAREGMAGPLKDVNWEKLDLGRVSQEEARQWEELFISFFMRHSRAELLDQAVKQGIILAPVNTTKDILEDLQLAARDYWVTMDHPRLGAVTYPGAPFQSTAGSCWIRRHAPAIGEHNEEIYSKELGFSTEELAVLKEGSTIYGGNLMQSRLPLEGLKICDFSWVGAAPWATMYLAVHGAKVIKVESSSRLDFTRLSSPFKDNIPGVNRSGVFLNLNTSKCSMTLNMRHPRAIMIIKRLVAWADVVTENFRPGVMEKWGLGYEELKKVNPDIIMVRSSIQGQTGPRAYLPGYGFGLNGLAGFNHLTGWPDGEPIGVAIAYTDEIVPLFTVIAILTALDYRQRTGEGQCIDLSQFEASLHFLAPALLDYAVNRQVQTRNGNRSSYAAPHGVYRCQGDERWCAIAVFSDEEWDAFCHVLGDPEWTKDPRFATAHSRKKNEDELDRLVEEWTINCLAEEIMVLMQAAGVDAGIVEDSQDLVQRDPQLKYRHHFQRVDHPEMGRCFCESPAFRLSKTSLDYRPAPCLGEHNEYVCKEILGMSDEEFIELLNSGALK